MWAIINVSSDHYDKYSDVEAVFGDDNTALPGNNVFGNVNQILKLKGRHRHLKTIISIGGWRLSETWSAAVSTPERRRRFVDTCMHCMYNFGWDGEHSIHAMFSTLKASNINQVSI